MIEVRQLRKSFGQNQVLQGVDLHINTGESVVIIGRSGCGKSVLLKHIIGLVRPDAGQVLVDGADLTTMTERQLLSVRRQFGMLFQGAALFDSLTVAENIAFILRREGRQAETDLRRRVQEALAMVDLAGVEDMKPAELSGGMRKRVGLARAIIHRPRIVLYDEPTTGLDPVVGDSINHLISRVCQRLACTTLVVTHDMRSAQRLAQRILMLHQGRIYAQGAPEAIFASDDPLVRQFINGVSDPKEVYF
jgi:phospholipid/cholesterol/gamma-HCH transport system ATP-binding protein